MRSYNPYFKPFGFEEMKEVAKKEFDYDLGDPSKIVMFGDELTTDIMFGNMNKMLTVWVHNFR